MEYLFCELCRDGFYREDFHMQHIFSKRHFCKSTTAASSNHSAYIAGYTFDSSTKDYAEHLERYGRIELIDLQKCTSVQEQIVTVYTALRLTELDKENREKLRVMVESDMKQYFPRCSVKLIGSSVDGFGSKGCEADLLLQTDGEIPTSNDLAVYRDIPTVNQVKIGDVSREVLNKLTTSQQMQFIRRVLLQKPEEYSRVHCIPTMTTTVINFFCDSHPMRCFLYNKNSLPLIKTRLFHLYANLDSRVVPLMTVLRRWGSSNECIGFRTLSVYAFSLLVIFFFQTRKPPVLPSVNFLRRKTNVKTVVDGWDCSFSSDISKLGRSENGESLARLLPDFFNYYKDFDFFSNVICPLSGCCEPKAKFIVKQSEDMNTMVMSPICIQDPFEVTRNCAENVDFPSLLLMVDHFKSVSEEFLGTPLVKNYDGESWGMAFLLRDPARRRPRDFKNNRVPSFTIVMGHEMLTKLRDQLNDDDSVSSDAWVNEVAKTFIDILRKVLLFECDIQTGDGNTTRSRKRKITNDDRNNDEVSSKIPRSDGMSNVRNISDFTFRIPMKTERSEDDDEQRNGGNLGVIRDHAKSGSENQSDEPFLRALVTIRSKTWINRRLPTPEMVKSSLQNVLENERNVSLELVRNGEINLKGRSKFTCEMYKSRRAGFTTLKLAFVGLEQRNFSLFRFLEFFMKRIYAL